MNNQNILFNQYLKENETIEWSGTPKQGILIRDLDMLVIPMSFILFGFALIIDYAVIRYDAPWLFKSLGFVLSVSFIYVGILRFFINARHRRNIHYAITSKRVLLFNSGSKKLQTLPLRNIEDLDITIEKDGSGFITFGSLNPVWPWLFGGFYFSKNDLPGLELIPNAKIVYNILNNLLDSNVDPYVIEKLKPGKEGLN
jgi:hypothetical protein